MKKIVLLALLIIFPVCIFAGEAYDVCFTPGQNCTQKIVDTINHAKKNLLVQAYSFTSVPIAEALVDAEKRGLEVKILLDKSQLTAKASTFKYLTENNMWIRIDYRPAIAHNKIIVVDRSVVVTGSFNFTESAQKKNAENLLIIYDKSLAEKYVANWSNREKDSAPPEELK